MRGLSARKRTWLIRKNDPILSIQLPLAAVSQMKRAAKTRAESLEMQATLLLLHATENIDQVPFDEMHIIYEDKNIIALDFSKDSNNLN